MNHNARLIFSSPAVSRNVTFAFLPSIGSSILLSSKSDEDAGWWKVRAIVFRHDAGERVFYPVIYLEQE